MYNQAMLLLLSSSWPSLLIGGLCLIIGFTSLGLTIKEWLEFLLSLPFTLINDQTQTEKEQNDQAIEEVASANPGCFFILVGLAFIGYGVFQLLK